MKNTICIILYIIVTLAVLLLVSCEIEDTTNDSNAVIETNIETETTTDFVIDGDTLVEYMGNEETVYIPKGIVTVGSCAFYQNKTIKTVMFSETVKCIENGAFRGCESLSTVELNEGLEEIYEYAFALCKDLEEIELPETLTFLHSGIFVGTGIEYLKVPGGVDSVTSLMSSSRDCGVTSDESLVTLEISSGTTSVKGFDNCLALKNVILPDTVTNVAGFDNCTALTNIPLHEGITNVAGFRGCEQLVDMKIPSTVKDFNALQETSFWEGDEEFLIVGDGVLIRIKTDKTSITIPKKVKYISYLVEGERMGLDEKYIFSPNLKEIILSAPAEILYKSLVFTRSNDIKFISGY